ncbi:MAG: aldo/keto reductase [Oscillospiraceae bacterium]|nr:aldo/keto reductase [Oscillospiraceae bacterium]
MQYRILGKSGLQISRLGFGGIPIQKTDATQTKKLMQALLDAGVNYIDTARGYTVSEEYLGEALEGIREHFVLATKSMSRDYAGMTKDIDISLKNLRTDYIDLYQIHNPNAAQLEQVLAPGGALEALYAAKAAGKIGHIGITLHSLELFQKCVEMDWVETIMFPYNIVETQGQSLIAKCAEKNIGFICMKPLAGGAIDDATLALRYIAANQNVTVVIPGMEAEDQITQNIAAIQDESPLSIEEQEHIQALRDSLGTHFCRRCNYCAPCSVGINISMVFLVEGYFTRYGLTDWARSRYATLDKKASDCIGCGVCESRCPYNLPIREMLKNAAKKLDN